MSQSIAVFDGDSGLRLVVVYNCPGCGLNHCFVVGNDDPKRNWEWNGDLLLPTFAPSHLQVLDGEVCHFTLRDGIFHFHDDCTHKLAGQSVRGDWG